MFVLLLVALVKSKVTLYYGNSTDCEGIAGISCTLDLNLETISDIDLEIILLAELELNLTEISSNVKNVAFKTYSFDTTGRLTIELDLNDYAKEKFTAITFTDLSVVLKGNSAENHELQANLLNFHNSVIALENGGSATFNQPNIKADILSVYDFFGQTINSDIIFDATCSNDYTGKTCILSSSILESMSLKSISKEGSLIIEFNTDLSKALDLSTLPSTTDISITNSDSSKHIFVFDVDLVGNEKFKEISFTNTNIKLTTSVTGSTKEIKCKKVVLEGSGFTSGSIQDVKLFGAILSKVESNVNDYISLQPFYQKIIITDDECPNENNELCLSASAFSSYPQIYLKSTSLTIESNALIPETASFKNILVQSSVTFTNSYKDVNIINLNQANMVKFYTPSSSNKLKENKIYKFNNFSINPTSNGEISGFDELIFEKCTLILNNAEISLKNIILKSDNLDFYNFFNADLATTSIEISDDCANKDSCIISDTFTADTSLSSIKVTSNQLEIKISTDFDVPLCLNTLDTAIKTISITSSDTNKYIFAFEVSKMSSDPIDLSLNSLKLKFVDTAAVELNVQKASFVNCVKDASSTCGKIAIKKKVIENFDSMDQEIKSCLIIDEGTIPVGSLIVSSKCDSFTDDSSECIAPNRVSSYDLSKFAKDLTIIIDTNLAKAETFNFSKFDNNRKLSIIGLSGKFEFTIKLRDYVFSHLTISDIKLSFDNLYTSVFQCETLIFENVELMNDCQTVILSNIDGFRTDDGSQIDCLKQETLEKPYESFYPITIYSNGYCAQIQDDQDCVEPNQINSYDFSKIGIQYTQIQIVSTIDLSADTTFDFRTLNHPVILNIGGIEDPVTWTLDLSKMGTQVTNLKVLAAKLNFITSETHKSLNVNSLKLLAGTTLDETAHSVDISNVKNLDFENYSHYNDFLTDTTIKDSISISTERKAVNQITLTNDGVDIKYSDVEGQASYTINAKEIIVKIFVTSDLAIKASDSFTRDMKITIYHDTYGSKVKVTADTNIPDSVSFGVTSSHQKGNSGPKLTFVYHKYDIPISIDANGYVAFEITPKIDSQKTLTLRDIVQVFDNSQIFVPDYIETVEFTNLNLLSNFLVELGSISKMKKLHATDVTISTQKLTIQDFQKSEINRPVVVKSSLDVGVASTMIVPSLSVNENAEVTLKYYDGLMFESIIQNDRPSNQLPKTINLVKDNFVGDKIVEQEFINILKIKEEDVDKVNIVDSTNKYKKRFMGEYVAMLQLIDENKPEPGDNIEKPTPNDSKVSLIAGVTSACVVVVIVVVVLVVYFCVCKKKAKESSSAKMMKNSEEI